ncbi:MAG: hypothetical protein QXK89_07285 [Candidatus Bathyarchaeia archaeon]
MESLKREILELLDRDLEFRYAVAGYLGLSEILKRLDSLSEEQTRLATEQTKIWMEIKGLREEQIGLREEQIRLREEQTKIWSEISKIWEEIKALREEQTKIWEEIKGLREEQIGLREEQIRLREEQTKIWSEIAALRRGQVRLERSVDSLRNAMIAGFGELSKFAGLSFEEFVRKFLSEYMRRSGEIPEDAELTKRVIDGEEVNLFLEEPLIVGEATGYAKSAEEITKLLRKAEVARAKYSREPRKILVILSANSDSAEEMRRISEEKNVELIIGKIVD